MFKTDEDLALAKQYFENHEDEKAEQIYKQLRAPGVHLTPTQNAKLLFQTAMLYKRQNKREEAAEQLRLLFHEGLHNSQQYNQTRAQHELGILAFEEKQYEKAVEFFRSELKIGHSRMEHYFRSLSLNFLWQGKCFIELNDWTEAAMYLRHAETFARTENDADAEAQALEAQVELQLRMGNQEEAAGLLQKTMEKYEKAGQTDKVTCLKNKYKELKR